MSLDHVAGRGPVAVVALRRAALAGLALIAIALVWRLWRRWHAVSRHLAHLTQEVHLFDPFQDLFFGDTMRE
jgi:hypothetical protein